MRIHYVVSIVGLSLIFCSDGPIPEIRKATLSLKATKVAMTGLIEFYAVNLSISVEAFSRANEFCADQPHCIEAPADNSVCGCHEEEINDRLINGTSTQGIFRHRLRFLKYVTSNNSKSQAYRYGRTIDLNVNFRKTTEQDERNIAEYNVVGKSTRPRNADVERSIGAVYLLNVDQAQT